MRSAFDGPLPVDIGQRLAKGDEQAFAQLYRCRRVQVFQTAYAIVKSYEEARDIGQEVFAAVWRYRESFYVVRNVDKYIHMTARNVSLSWRDNLHRETKYVSRLTCPSPVRAPDVVLETKEFFSLFHDTVQKLPPRQRDIFHLLRDEMKTHEEVSRELNISPFTVNNHIKQALITLRGCLIK